MKKRILLRSIPMLLLMLIIFCYSAQTATESTSGSDPIVLYVAVTIGRIRSLFGLETHFSASDLSTLSFLIRKLAHTAEFAMLGFSLSFFFGSFRFSFCKRFFLVLALGFLYASSDEIHQFFVEGRSSEFRDVLIDTNGVFLALLFEALIRKLRSLKKWVIGQNVLVVNPNH